MKSNKMGIANRWQDMVNYSSEKGGLMNTDVVKLIATKISEYELHVNLFVGALWILITGILFEPRVFELSIGFMLVLAYFTGLVCGRIGSHLIEPVLRSRMPYQPFAVLYATEKKDEKIISLMKVKAIYRNLAALMLITVVMRLWLYPNVKMFMDDASFSLMTVSLFIIFVASYIKQAEYVDSRVDAAHKTIEAEKKAELKAFKENVLPF